MAARASGGGRDRADPVGRARRRGQGLRPVRMPVEQATRPTPGQEPPEDGKVAVALDARADQRGPWTPAP